MGHIYQVRELTRAVKSLLEGQFPFVWVQGEISALSRPSSGHIYFSLKDEEASLAAVWFRGNQQAEEAFDPLTGEVYAGGPRPGLAARLENGLEVICAGRLTVYPPRGGYQIVAELVQEAGKGRQQIEFELLKAELAAKGYFDPQRKKALPLRPRRVAVITSPSGAAVHDFLRIAGPRGLASEIRVYPSLVQGDAAPAGLAAALGRACAEGWAEVLVLIRGGGSLEDLWAFNSRKVAEAIFASPLPVLSGVGHEVDVTLADLVADLRAATPSHAAQLLWPERRELAQRVDELEMRLQAAVQAQLGRFEKKLAAREQILRLLSPLNRLEKAALALESLTRRLTAAVPASLDKKERGFRGCLASLERAMPQRLDLVGRSLENFSLRLAGLDPQLPLRRGYALVKKADGGILRSSVEASPGDGLELCLVDGTVPVVVANEDRPQPRICISVL
ncbi:MAG: exodeoxyribonuclease VII large subunit [Deltaproteobacteria bacterium]|jgi:exodeoxyribonuclease VII large subunit|nr:exodeoxyribonuclease VII large subunit [Deltaproteobacteria bacterium]